MIPLIVFCFIMIIFSVNSFIDVAARFTTMRHVTFSSTRDVSDWLSFENCEVLLPLDQIVPKSIIHFTGGFVAGSAVSVGYNPLLRLLQKKGHLIIATAIPAVEMNHTKVSQDTYDSFLRCYQNFIMPGLGNVGSEIPVIGMSHSLGGKLMVLSGSRKPYSIHDGNIFLAFNNYGAKDSFDISAKQASKLSPELQKIFENISFGQVQNVIDKAKSLNFKDILTSTFNGINMNPKDSDPSINDLFGKVFGEQLNTINNVISEVDKFSKEFEFKPTPNELWEILESSYTIEDNIVFKFTDDEIDQSLELAKAIRRGGGNVELISLPGNHLTPNVLDPSDSSISIFLKELSIQVDVLADRLEGSSSRKDSRRPPRVRSDRYYLPGPKGSNSPGGLYLPGGGTGAEPWIDSDDF